MMVEVTNPRTAPKLRYRTALGVAAGLGILVIFAFSQMYGGKTWDEDTHITGLQQQMQIVKFIFGGVFHYRYLDVMQPELAYYGGLPVYPAYIAQQVIIYLANVTDLRTQEVILTWSLHANAYLYGVLTCGVVYKLAVRLTPDWRPAAICPVLLYLYPVWLGQSFFNYKDMPTAFFFTLAVLCSVHIYRPQNHRDFCLGAYGLAASTIGLIGVKLVAAGLIVPAWLAFLYASRHRPIFFLCIAIATSLGAYAITPQAWLSPITYPFEDIIYMARHPWNGCTLTFGECVPTHAANWSTGRYLLEWLSVRLPLILILGSPIAVFIFAFGPAPRKLLAGSFLFPPALIISLNSTVYDGIRHILFLIPLLFTMTVIMLCDLARRNKYWSGVVAASLVAYLAAFSVDDAALFPYNYVYFNIYGRQIADKEKFDLDYWVFSSREVASIAQQLEENHPNLPVAIYAPPKSVVTPFMKSGTDVTWLPELDSKYKGAYYSILFNRMGLVAEPGCEKIGEISRSLPLASKTLDLVDISICRKGG